MVIVDTSNEIAGDGDIPHLQAIGQSRRMMVPNKDGQHRCNSIPCASAIHALPLVGAGVLILYLVRHLVLDVKP